MSLKPHTLSIGGPLLAVMLGAAAGTAHADAAAEAELARRLAGLRGELEDLSSTLADKSDDVRDELRSYNRQKVELQLEAQREESRLKKLRAAIAKKQEEIEEKKQSHASLEPTFQRNLEAARAYVRGTLPFRTQERLHELDAIAEQLRSNLLTPQRALARLWSFMEDELRLTRESGMYRQTIHVDGRAQLADVVRVGMVMLFFRTADETYGFAVRQEAGWAYEPELDTEHRRRIRTLFQDFQKQIHVGYFELPNALAVRAGR